jgi:hypothetical protein
MSNDNGPDPEVLKAALEAGQQQEADQDAATKRMLQEKLNDGVRQLRALAKEHDLDWPEEDILLTGDLTT